MGRAVLLRCARRAARHAGRRTSAGRAELVRPARQPGGNRRARGPAWIRRRLALVKQGRQRTGRPGRTGGHDRHGRRGHHGGPNCLWRHSPWRHCLQRYRRCRHADAGTADEDDWPTRYSWLDDDTDEAGEVTGTAGETAHRAGDTPHAADDTAQAAGAPATVGTPTADARPAAETVATPALDAGTLDDDPADSPAAEDDALIIAFPGPGAAAEPGTASADAPDEPATEADGDGGAVGEAEGDPPAAAPEDDAEAGPGLVTVVPGVPRYHRTDCVLIRFMPAGDVHQVPVSEARDAGCTPCAACQPEG